ncbi:hypothetical protein QN277_022067 [Acacia crassicarpa]|uniref:Acidic endochitinase n=1 Tax=Acacia crassicarpa TaxID=499986 RepID=A0AAE1K997_9FABA|nr:hypothetical protein QN277_022067 [Acacia crassicarpa]
MRNKKSNSEASLVLFLITLAIMVPKSKGGDTVIYWGQDGKEGTLSEACNSGLYNIVNIAFLSTFGNGSQPKMDLSGHCDTSSNACQTLTKDINNCQNQGIKVIISIGGGTQTYSLSSRKDAINVADYIWNNFLGGNSTSRPLGDAILDGVDFDIEAGGGEAHYGELARRLKKHSKRGRKKLYLTAAPQCPFPDAHLKGALSSGLFDFVWVQFYNNPPCQFSSMSPSNFRTAWAQWASSVKGAQQLYLGLPASPSAAGSGYVPTEKLIAEVLPFVKKSPQYGGVMLWNSLADKQTGYSSNIKTRV